MDGVDCGLGILSIKVRALSAWSRSNSASKLLNEPNLATWRFLSRSGPPFPDYLEIDLGAIKSVNEVHVFTLQDNYSNPAEPTQSMTFTLWGLTGYELEYWNGSNWLAIPGAIVSGNNKVWRTFTFSPISTRKIRVKTTASVDGYSRITEVEVYGPAEASGAGDGIHWLVVDHLGTPRMVLDQTGSLAGVKRHDYLPFGEELFAPAGGRSAALGYAGGDGVRQQFTLKERDVETGLDYFLARYYSSTQGRFTSPDEFTGGPEELYDFVDDAASNPIFYAELEDPQSLNKYQYAYNNPLRYNDPDGRQGQGEKSLTQRIREGAQQVKESIQSGAVEAKETAKRTFNGAVSALAEDNGLGPLNAEQNTAGRAIGHGLAVVQGGAEIYGGIQAIAGGSAGTVVTAPACGTGVGCAAPAAGVGTVVVGVAVAAHGTVVLGKTLKNIFNRNTSGQSSGSSQQPKAEAPKRDMSPEGTQVQR